MNAFETGVRKVIPAVLVYIKADGCVLMIHRNARGAAADYHADKWNGLGGKCEPDESPLEAAVREIREEAGIELAREKFRALGVLQFPNFKAHKSEDWIATVFVVHAPEARARICEGYSSPENPEGTLHWVPERDLLSLNLWAGDREFIPLVQAEKPFIGTVWYQGEKVLRSWMQEL